MVEMLGLLVVVVSEVADPIIVAFDNLLDVAVDNHFIDSLADTNFDVAAAYD